MGEYLPQAVAMLRHNLFAWYRRKRNAFPNMTRMQDLTLGMLGSNAKRSLRAKAAETKYFLKFLQDLLVTHAARLVRGDLWKAAVDHMVHFVDAMQLHTYVVEAHQLQDTRGKH